MEAIDWRTHEGLLVVITILVAMDDSRVIGNKGQLPWNHPEDLKIFKRRTTGHAIIMGRKTWDSLPKQPLPNRMNIVVSRSPSISLAQHVAPTLEYAVALAKYQHQEVFIIGGAQIYQQALEKGLVDRILISRMVGEHEGDVFFPELGDEWIGKAIEHHETFDVWEYVR